MDASIYRLMAEIEDAHWWFRARRLIVCNTIKRLTNLPVNADILEAGCGAGGNLRMLQEFGNVSGMDMNEEAINLARKRSLVPVFQGVIPYSMPFSDESFNLILLLDVLEHVDDDVVALKALKRLLKPEGYLLITVPAFPFLWSYHDTMHHHKRRYYVSELFNKVGRLGFKIRYISYYNFFLFPPIALIRFFKTRIKLINENHDLKIPSQFVNELLAKIFSCERRFISSIKLPFGVSIIACAQKNKD